MVNLLWREGNHGAAIRLEEMWNAFGRANSARVLCGYAMDNFVKETHTAEFARVCEAHTHVQPAESYQEAGIPARGCARSRGCSNVRGPWRPR